MTGSQQKIELFADDVLIYVEKPNSTLPIHMTVFKDFEMMSGYKINVQKTQVITFNYEPNQEIRDNYKVNWDLKYMKYLGIYLPKDLERLKSLNYDRLISLIKADLTKWNLIPYLGLASRVEVIKMNILPKLLYLFQNLPVELSEKEFKEWDKIISRFVWKGAKPKIKYRTLQLPKVQGGLALPYLKSYFRAAQLKVLLSLSDPEYPARWKDIEETLVRRLPIQAIMYDANLWSIWQCDLNSWLGLSIKIWSEIVKKYNLKSQCKFLRWIAYDLEFTPDKLDNRFKLWENGPKMHWEIIKNTAIMSFQEIKDLFELDNKDFYR